MKIAITRKDEGVKEIDGIYFKIIDGAVVVYKENASMYFYACADWLDVEVVDEA